MSRHYDLRGLQGFPLIEIIDGKYENTYDYLAGYALCNREISSALFTSIEDIYEVLDVPFITDGYVEIREALEQAVRMADSYGEDILPYSNSAVVLNNLLISFELDHLVEDDLPFLVDHTTFGITF